MEKLRSERYKTWSHILLKISIGISTSLVTAYLGISAYAAYSLSQPQRIFNAQAVNIFPFLPEEVQFQENDNLTRKGWLITSIQKEWQSVSGLPDIFLPSTIMFTNLITGYNITSSKPVNEINRITPRPVLIIHSSLDTFIPVSNAERLKASSISSQLWKTSALAL